MYVYVYVYVHVHVYVYVYVYVHVYVYVYVYLYVYVYVCAFVCVYFSSERCPANSMRGSELVHYECDAVQVSCAALHWVLSFGFRLHWLLTLCAVQERLRDG